MKNKVKLQLGSSSLFVRFALSHLTEEDKILSSEEIIKNGMSVFYFQKDGGSLGWAYVSASVLSEAIKNLNNNSLDWSILAEHASSENMEKMEKELTANSFLVENHKTLDWKDAWEYSKHRTILYRGSEVAPTKRYSKEEAEEILGNCEKIELRYGEKAWVSSVGLFLLKDYRQRIKTDFETVALLAVDE